MKAPENVKQKALDKYKEITNKGNENCAKSQQYLEDENGSAVMTSGELPYRFNNQFKSPIRIEPGNKIELISADLNVLPLNDISTHNDNDNFTSAFGKNDTGYLQKVSKIHDNVNN